MTASPGFLEHLTDMLAPLGPVSARRMFGGAGIFRDGLMFALVADDTLYFKVDDRNRAAFEAAGMPPFRYEKRGKTFEMSYYEAPADALDDGEELLRWAEGAWDAAVRAGAAKGKKTSR
ncbi:MAG: TfoX/Sxy family protein [Alphaproteobacteria bacterium]|nr:TfoX/Sxy family protein [Alphaproteobacteria bacterium]